MECRQTPHSTIWAPEGRGEQSSFGRNSRVRRQIVQAVDEGKRSNASSTVAPQDSILSVQNLLDFARTFLFFCEIKNKKQSMQKVDSSGNDFVSVATERHRDKATHRVANRTKGGL